MSPLLIGAIGLAVLFALMAAGMPIGFSMALVGFAGFAFLGGLKGGLSQLATVPFSSVATYTLTIIPLFILMGEIAGVAGLVKGAFSAANKWLANLRGGLAMTTIAACGAFAAVCGSSLATATAMTSIAYPEMGRYKYDPALSLGSIAAGGTLGILIPPSIPLIVYAIFAEESVGRLYMAGFLPGILLSGLFIATIYIRCKFTPSLGPPGPKSSWRERLVAVKDVGPVLILAIVVLGGIWGGIFTPNEAAGIGVFIALILGLAARQLSMKKLIFSLMETASLTAMIFSILIGAMIFNYFVVLTGVPAELARLVEAYALPGMYVYVAILLIYAILGCIMDTFAITMLTLPIFLPTLRSLGFDLVWFGVIYVTMIEMANITPPIGVNVFVVAGMVREVPMYTIFRGILPFFFAMVICIVILTVFPQIALFLPSTMME